MAWGDWMVPTLTPSASFQLETQKRTLRSNAADHPDEVTNLAISLLESNAMLQSVVRKATNHIAELELKEILADDEPPPPIPLSSQWLRVPRLLRIALKFYGYDLAPNHVSTNGSAVCSEHD